MEIQCFDTEDAENFEWHVGLIRTLQVLSGAEIQVGFMGESGKSKVIDAIIGVLCLVCC